MGKSSSAKKVARAARAAGRTRSRQRRNLAFPGVIAAIVFLGVGLVVVAASDRKSQASTPPEAWKDHWHAAYGLYVCDEFKPTVNATTPGGVHTHADGVIHIHPYSSSEAGARATMGKFLEATHIELSDDELRIGDESWREGRDTCGDEDIEVVVAQWKKVQHDDAEPEILRDGLAGIRFTEDGMGFTIAVVPAGTTDIPKPETAPFLEELGLADDDGFQGGPPVGGELPADDGTGQPGPDTGAGGSDPDGGDTDGGDTDGGGAADTESGGDAEATDATTAGG